MFAYLRFFSPLITNCTVPVTVANSVDPAHADVDARMDGGTALAHDDGAGVDQFAAIGLDAQAFRFGIATVAC